MSHASFLPSSPAITNTMATPPRARYAHPHTTPIPTSNLPRDEFARVRKGVRPLRYLDATVNGRPITYTSHTAFHIQAAAPVLPGEKRRFRTLTSYVGDLGAAVASYISYKPMRMNAPSYWFRLVMVSPAGKQTVIAGHGAA